MRSTLGTTEEPRTDSFFLFLKECVCVCVHVDGLFAYTHTHTHTHTHTIMCMPDALGGQKRTFNHLELELKTVVRCHVGTYRQAQDLWESSNCSSLLSPLCSPQKTFPEKIVKVLDLTGHTVSVVPTQLSRQDKSSH